MMLTKETLLAILTEFQSKKDVACTYDFKEKFGVALAPLEILGIAKVVKNKIPSCGQHCNRYENCQWIDLLQSRKSKSLYRFTKKGFVLASSLQDGILSSDEKDALLLTFLQNNSLSQLFLSLQQDRQTIQVAVLVSYLLANSSLSIYAIRSCLQDILDLFQSLGMLEIKEGAIITNF
ncbi:MAG: hypothetical protein ACTSXO_11650 [Candidatus Heimdallarchaeota archaeon]